MRLLSLAILLLISSLAFSQNVEFKASAPSVVAQGEQFRLTYSINKQGTNLQIPTLEGFDLLMGPSTSQSSSFQMINGKTTQSVSFTYTYIMEGTKEGTFNIPSATIHVDGKEYKSNSLRIEVVKGTPASSSDSQQSSNARGDASASINETNLFVTVEPDRRSLYLGESLAATIKVYSKVDLTNFGRSKFPSFEGFLSEEVPTAQRIELVRETYNGQIYNVGIIRKMLLFPQHTGDIVIEPFELECIVRQRLTESRNFFDDFFGNYRDVRATRRSKPVTIKVKELPNAGKPLGFSGTVGNISMTPSISADTVNANDAITYKLTFRGTGNLKLLKAPSINFPPDFEVYDPKETRDIKVSENGTTGTVVFEYLAIPRYSGDYKIPAVKFSYFDPQSNSYKTLNGREYKVHVRKGAERDQAGVTNNNNNIQSFKKEDVRFLGEDIRYLKTDDLNLKKKYVRFFGTVTYWLLFIVPFVLFVSGIILNRRRIKANADIVRVKNKAANKMAQKRLKIADVAMKNHNSEQFYDETLKALWGYMSYKLNIDRAELKRDNVNDILCSKGVDSGMIQEFIDVLDTCEYARYAPANNPDQQMEDVYRKSIDIITKLDKAIK